MKPSNKYTLMRIVLAPVFLILFFLPVWLGSISGFEHIDLVNKITGILMIPLLAYAEFTDFLDGYMARKRGEVSDFGKIFDPFADVILHLTTFACFTVNGYMNPLIFILLLYREFTMTFFRMVAAKKGVAIAARKGGKLKTVMYVVTGFGMLAFECTSRMGVSMKDVFDVALTVTVWVLSLVSLGLSYISFFDYLKNFGSVLKGELD